MKRRWKLLLLLIIGLGLLILYESEPVTAEQILSWQPWSAHWWVSRL